VAETCRILRLSRSSYYRRRRALTIIQPEAPAEDVSENALLETIRDLAGKHPFWGYRRITAFLQHKCSLGVNRKRVRRLIRLDGLSVPVKRYKAKRAETRSKPQTTRRNEWWGTDMTKFYVQGLGWLYLVVVIDWYTKRALGYSLGLRPKTDLWLEALHQAVDVACPAGSRSEHVHLMSDNGSRPTSTRYETILETLSLEHVTTSYNIPKGNADTERFMRTFKEEVVWPNEFESLGEATRAADDFFRFYNQDYPHSALMGMSPIDFEASLNQTQTAAA
jgi:putative transposase